MSSLDTVLEIWLGINVAFPLMMLLRQPHPHAVMRMYHWVVEAKI
jgi:hypothetical protein